VATAARAVRLIHDDIGRVPFLILYGSLGIISIKAGRAVTLPYLLINQLFMSSTIPWDDKKHPRTKA
jgi:hypothetical protein